MESMRPSAEVEKLRQEISRALAKAADQLSAKKYEKESHYIEGIAFTIATVDMTKEQLLQYVSNQLENMQTQITIEPYSINNPLKFKVNIDPVKDAKKKIEKIVKKNNSSLPEKKEEKNNQQADVTNLANMPAVYQDYQKWKILDNIAQKKLTPESTDFYKAYIKFMINPTYKSLKKLDETYIAADAEIENFGNLKSDDSNARIEVPQQLREPYNTIINKIGEKTEITPELLQPLVNIGNHIANLLKINFEPAFKEAQIKKPGEEVITNQSYKK